VVGWQIDNEIRGHQKILRLPLVSRVVEQVVGKNVYGDDLKTSMTPGEIQVWKSRLCLISGLSSQPYRVCCWSHAYPTSDQTTGAL